MKRKYIILFAIALAVFLLWKYRYAIRYFFAAGAADLIPVSNKENAQKIKTLHPLLRTRAKMFLIAVKQQLGIDLIVTSATRSIEKQAYLYQTQNNAAPPGNSLHNYGLAFDVVSNSNPPLNLNSSRAAWAPVVAIAAKHGLKWGGEFSGNYDPIHFYNDFGTDRQELKDKYAAKDLTNGFVNIG